MILNELITVEEPLAKALLAGDHEIQRQVRVPGGRVDIWDGTTSTIIECKAVGDTSSIITAVKQLRRYYPNFYDPQLAVAVPRIEPEAKWLADALRQTGIFFIEIERGVGV